MEDLDDYMLTQILLRLPHCKTVKACSPVNKRWCSLISDPSFPDQFTNHKKKTTTLIDDEPPWAFIINMVNTNGPDPYEVNDMIKLTTEFISGSPKLSLEFMPGKLFTAWASFKDLILSPSNQRDGGLVYYITNPLTKQWVALPPRPCYGKPITSAALICQPPYNHTQHYNFRVMEVRRDYLVVYCSEIGEWKEIKLRIWSPYHEIVICNGIIYFKSGLSLVGLDPFDVNDTCDTTLEARVMPPLPDFGYLLESSGQLLLVQGLQATERWGTHRLWYKIDGTAIELEMVMWKLDLNQTPLVWQTTFKGLCKGTVNSIEFPDSRLQDSMYVTNIGVHPYSDKLIYMYLASEKQFVLCDLRTGCITSSKSFSNDYRLRIQRLEQQWWPTSVPALPRWCNDENLPPLPSIV